MDQVQTELKFWETSVSRYQAARQTWILAVY